MCNCLSKIVYLTLMWDDISFCVENQNYFIRTENVCITWSPNSNAAFRRGICFGESGGVAILNTSWANLNNCEELWICRWATSKTVLNLIMLPKIKEVYLANMTKKNIHLTKVMQANIKYNFLRLMPKHFSILCRIIIPCGMT